MVLKVVDDVKVHIDGCDDMEDDEIREYTKLLKAKDNIALVREYKIIVADDGTVTIDPIDCEIVKFERIRRITGYLVGTTARWNDAKQEELANRVKHTKECGCIE